MYGGGAAPVLSVGILHTRVYMNACECSTFLISIMRTGVLLSWFIMADVNYVYVCQTYPYFGDRKSS